MAQPQDEAATAVVTMSADGTEWRDVSPPLASVEVEDDDRLTDKATIVFDDSTSVLAHLSFEGLFVRIAMGWRTETATIFEGVVSSARVLAGPTGQTLELTALDFTSLMTKRTFDPMEWQPGEKLSDVVRRVVSRPEYKLVPFQIQPANDALLDERRPQRPANLTEWEFVRGQAEKQGCLAFVEFDGKGKSNFYFVPITQVASAAPVGNLSYCRGSGELLEFTYERISSGAIPVLGASTIDPTSGVPIAQPGAEQAPRPPLPPPATERDKDLGPGRRAAAESLAELAAVADARLRRPTARVSGAAAGTAADVVERTMTDPTKVAGLLGTGVATGTVLMRAKARVRIGGVAPWAEGEWYLRKVNHVYRRERTENRTRSSYFTKFTATR
ncbi:hypothetical protein ILP97_05070 [Amycolatopsis sp. H6(2020)]|nr:hypothetical protein [Amycolatopsis sp. H6(2020)]